MSSTITFDTLAYAKKLIAVGVPVLQAEVQAETFSEVIEDNFAKKKDLKELEVSLKRDIKEFEVSLKSDIKELEVGLNRDIKELEVSLKRDMNELEVGLKRDIKELELKVYRDMKEVEMRLTIRLGAMMAASIAIVAALVKLL